MSIRTLSVTYVENYEYTNKDLRALSRKQISRDLRVFGVKFQAKIFIRVKNLTFCNSGATLKYSHKVLCVFRVIVFLELALYVAL